MKILNLNNSHLKKILLSILLLFWTAAVADVSVREASEISNDTIDWMKIVADWQLTQSSWDSSVSWERGALHAGMMACYEATKDEKYLEKCREWSEKFNWQLGWNNSNHADNMACAQTYLELYLLDEQDPFRYADYKSQNDTFVNDPERFDCINSGDSDQWWWCDALFMAPPALVRLSRAIDDPIYTQAMHIMWSDTQSCLYDTEEHLFYRDINYLPPYNYNGKKVFWSRGNGWVIAGTARVLQYLPLEDTNRSGYVTLLQDMAAKLADIQLEDGYWHSDLLSPERFDVPETSGTGFFTYGIAWGVNNGFLNESEYWGNVEAGWDALRAAVKSDGLLGWVQPVGADPRLATEYGTDVFGIGAYLLAGSEIYKYQLAHDSWTIDCFESYVDSVGLSAAWSDGTINSSSSEATLGDYGDNFMKLAYNNGQYPYYSETTKAFATPMDFAADEAYYLSVLVRGDVANAEESMFIRLEDVSSNTATVVMDDKSIVQTASWQELGFKLADFSGIDKTQIVKLTIGIGTAGRPDGTGSGTVRVDNIRLMPKECIAADDIVFDCNMNMQDFALLAAEWLDENRIVVSPVDPGSENLVGYWPLNESYQDVTGNGYDAQSGSSVIFDSGYSGSSVYFDGTDYASYLVCENSNNLDFENGLTISVWIKSSGQQDQWASVVTKGLQAWRLIRNSTGNSLSFHFNKSGGGEYQANGSIEVMDGQWHHVMAVYDGSELRLYIDGQLDASTAAGSVNTTTDPVYIGSRVNNTSNRNWIGNIDDVRLYNIALDESNLLYLADKPGYVELPEEKYPADLVFDGIVDMVDLQVLAEKWAQEIIWP